MEITVDIYDAGPEITVDLSSETLEVAVEVAGEGPPGKSPYIGPEGTWMQWQDSKWVDTGVAAGGGTGGGYKIGNGLKLDTATNTLSVNTAKAVEQDNTLPITAAAVYTTVGNIEVLLGMI